MKFPKKYKIMPGDCYSQGDYKLIPIRYEDRQAIMNWRNQQIYHLRQKEFLTEEQQDQYFQNVVSKLFEEEYPNQILFSYLENDRCIGYGGLVHIDWYSKNAEISFIIDPDFEKEHFDKHWKTYLGLLYKYAFEELNLHKIYTYAFDLRPHLYAALEGGGLVEEARLKEHFYFEGEYKDVVIHSQRNEMRLDKSEFYLKSIEEKDSEILFHWANESSVRENSFSVNDILWEDHNKWFSKKLKSSKTHIYMLCNTAISRPLGQIRIDYDDEKKFWNIDTSIDKLYRRQNLGTKMFSLLTKKHPSFKFYAEVKKLNTPSQRAFINAGFKAAGRIEDVLIFKYNSK